jgi:TRAP-type C4-dicarboxylate transport system substrate-binding protein
MASFMPVTSEVVPDSYITVSQFTSFTFQFFDRLTEMEQRITALAAPQGCRRAESSQEENEEASSEDMESDLHNTPVLGSSTRRKKGKESQSRALAYYECEQERNKKWMFSPTDDYIKDLEDERQFLNVFDSQLPAFSAIM